MTHPFSTMSEHSIARFQRLAKEGSWIVVGQIATVTGSLALVRFLTEHLSPIQYGELALGLTIAGLMNQAIFGGIVNGIGRYYAVAAEARDLNGYLRDSRTLLAYGTLVATVIGAMLMIGLQWFGYSRWMGLAVAALVFSLLVAYNGAIDGIQNAARQRAIVALHGGLHAWLKILLALVFMTWLGTTSTAVVIGYAGTVLLVALSQLVFLRRTIPPRTATGVRHHAWLHRIWSYSWPFSTFGIFTWMQQVSDRWALEGFTSTMEVGQYSVLFQLGYTPVAMATGLAVAFAAPILFQRSGDATNAARNANVHHLTWKLTYLSVILTALGTLVAFVMHEKIFRLLVGSEYRTLSDLLPWFVLAGGLFAAGQTLSLKLMSEMKTRAIASAKIITAILGVVLNVVGAALAGLNGVVAALLAFSASYFVWMVLLARKQSV